MLKVRERSDCRICGSPLPQPFLTLGAQPPANNLLDDPGESEESYPLQVSSCDQCRLVQLRHVVNPDLLFKHYLYVPSASKMLVQHFASLAEALTIFQLQENSLTVDIGSNEGLLLGHLKSKGYRVIGVDPAQNLAKSAEAHGIPTICDYFGSTAVERILASQGPADVVTATNVFAHVDDINNFASHVSRLLKPDGVFVIEVPDLWEMLDQGTFDLIYHEHLSYFALTPLARLFRRVGMDIFHVDHVPIHGGSLRIFVHTAKGTRAVNATVAHRLESESFWLNDAERYERFSQGIQSLKTSFTALIEDLKAQGKRIAGYGLPAKANTLMNYCGITSEQIDYIVDDNPLKCGKWAPGSRIPIVPADRLDEDPVEAVVIFPWNLEKEIKSKLQKYSDNGTEIFVPTQEGLVRGV